MITPNDDIIYGRTALREHVPWIVPESLDLLETLIQPDWHIFEWGSGGSTVYWAKRCALVVSVEHNTEWMERTSKMLHTYAPRNNWMLVHRPGVGKDSKTAFRVYADAIKLMPDNMRFDLIYVDGEASSRAWCLDNAILYLKPGGWLLLDNSDWLKREMTGWERHDFVARDLKWVGQPGTFNWHTSLLRKPL